MGFMKLLNFSLVLILVCFFTVMPTMYCFADLNPVQARNEAKRFKKMKPDDAAKSIKRMKPGDKQKILSLLPGKYRKAVNNNCSATPEKDKPPPFFIFIPTKIDNFTPTYDILPDATNVGQESVQIEPPVVENGHRTLPSLEDIKPLILDYPIESPMPDALAVHPDLHLYYGDTDGLKYVKWVAAGVAGAALLVVAYFEIQSFGIGSPVLIPIGTALSGFIALMLADPESELNTEGSQTISFEHEGETLETFCYFNGDIVVCDFPENV